MTSFLLHIKHAALALALAAATMSVATAAEFQARRGLNLDLWTTWPAEEKWGDPTIILPFPEWRRTLDAAGLAALKADGFDFLRMPVDPAPFLSDTAAPLRDKLLASVLDSVHLINAAGLKVIVDLHLIPSNAQRAVGMREVLDHPETFQRYVDLVRDMAKTLSKEDPKLVALEPMNEPVIDCDGDGTDNWPRLQKQLFAAARASATRLSLVLTGACYSSADRLAAVDPGDYPDDNILWGFHSYDPFLLTHQGATWAGDFIPYVTGLPYPLTSVSRSELDAILDRIRQRVRDEAPAPRQAGILTYLDELVATIDTPGKLGAVLAKPFDTVATWAKAHGVKPADIMLSEFGMIRQEYGNPYVVPSSSRAAYYKDMLSHAEQAGFAWSMWSYGGAFGIVEQFGGKKAEPDVVEMVRGLAK